MNDEPPNPGLNTDTMDTQLQKLERELFSLTPAETPRFLDYKLSRRLEVPTQVPRKMSSVATPFRWRRMVVPAAAAVVVVSGLNRMPGPGSAPTSSAPQVGVRVPSQPLAAAAAASIQKSPRFVLKTEPLLLNHPDWQGMQNPYWTQSGNTNGMRFSEPRRGQSAVVPVLFH